MTRKTGVVVAVIAGLAIAGAVGASAVKKRGATVPVQTGKVARRDLVSVVSASGEIKPKKYVNVGANVSGRIEQLLVKEGDPVKAGQVLCRIESTRFAAGEQQAAAALEASRADLQRAQADLDNARVNLDRVRRMHDDKLVADHDLDTAAVEVKMKAAAVDAQRRRVTQMEAALASNRDDLEKTVVISPMEGVVTSLQKEQGEVVIGAQSFSPTVIMTVADLSVMEVEVLVDETDIRNVALGQTAEVRVDALEGQKLKGDVTEIGSSAIPRGGQTTVASATPTSNQAKDFKVTVTLVDPPKVLRPGLNATADITTATKKGALSVPIQAVVVREVDSAGKVVEPEAQKPEEGVSASNAPRARGEEKDGVFVVKDGKSVFRPVKTGIMGETDIEVAEGLSEGEEVVTGSYKTLRTLKVDAKLKVEKDKKS